MAASKAAAIAAIQDYLFNNNFAQLKYLERLTADDVLTILAVVQALDISMKQGATLLQRLEECQRLFQLAKERRVPRIIDA